ncbi:MAG TPA: protein phosphatase CheZ [Steroidobacteraceae bacterium]|jgi:chemotaxis protein CheZ
MPAAMPTPDAHSQLTLEVRRVASELQSALDHFRVDSKLIDLAQRQVPDARHRLAHVIRLTDDAAHRTIDLVEQCGPLADRTVQEAGELLAQRATGPGTALAPQVSAFLVRTGKNMQSVRANLAEVLLAQGYQDLTGQIIRGVMTLVDELEHALGELLRIAGAEPEPRPGSATADGWRGHGPMIPGVDHGPAVSDQQDVDALLSNLGM